MIAAAYYFFDLNAVLAFWLAYILTRPLGASIGDGLSQSSNGGLGLGTTGTSYLFLGGILVLVTFLSITRRDQTPFDGGPGLGVGASVTSSSTALTSPTHPENARGSPPVTRTWPVGAAPSNRNSTQREWWSVGLGRFIGRAHNAAHRVRAHLGEPETCTPAFA